MLWHKLTLNRDQLEAGEKGRVVDAFRQSHSGAGSPRDAALMENILADETGAIDTHFSPAAAAIAQRIIDRFAGIPCNPPPRPQAEVLHGPSSSLDLLDEAA